ncbi:hypothetical protein LINPERPRIM_LOCUS6629 [Linum perenne]
MTVVHNCFQLSKENAIPICVSGNYQVKCLCIHSELEFALMNSSYFTISFGGSPLKSLGNAVGSFEGKSLEDVLKEQMNNQEFDEGGIGGLPPIDGSGGGDGGGDDPQGPPDDEDLPGMLDETLQMVLASVGFVLAYRYILDGEGMMKIVKDYFKFLFTGYKSVRLRRLFEELETWWHEICKTAGPRKMVYKDKFWLERAIMNNTTWFDHPDKYMRLYRLKAPAKKVRKLLKRRLRGRGRSRIFINYFDNNVYYDNY